jgi:hypothetical protein
MRTLLPLFQARFLRSTVLAVATLGAASSLLACAGDDTNPAAPATDSGTGDASKPPSEGGSGGDSSTTTDAGGGTDSGGATDSAGQPG